MVLCLVISAAQYLHRVSRSGGLDGQRSDISPGRRHHDDVAQFLDLPAQQHQPAALQRQRTAHHVRGFSHENFVDFDLFGAF